MPTLAVADATLHYSIAGTGPAVLLLHSLGGAGEMWNATISALSAGYTVIAPDARGHGRSSDGGEISVRQFAKDSAAILEGVGIGAAHVVGLSMGGQAAMHLAMHAPEMVHGLVLADTSLGGRGGAEERVAGIRKRIAEIGAEGFAREYTLSRTMPETDEATKTAFAALVLKTLPDIYARQAYSISCEDLRATAGTIAAPTLVIAGDHDASTPPEMGRQLRDAIPGAAMSVIRSANHLSNLDQPGRFNALLRQFLESNRTASL
jgi:pimeloyl-ACP methyl ester carboxylesterase